MVTGALVCDPRPGRAVGVSGRSRLSETAMWDPQAARTAGGEGCRRPACGDRAGRGGRTRGPASG